MKKYFWLVLLANVLLIVLIQRGWVWGEQARHIKPSMNEEKVQVLLGQKKVPPAIKNTSSPLDLRLSLNAPPPVPPAPSEVKEPICLEWGDFSGADLKLATAKLSEMKLGKKLDKRQLDQVIRYWVYMPPQKNKAGVERKIAQLKDRGVNDYFVIQEAGSWRNAISLGVFKTQEAAEKFLKHLRTKDVRTARVGARAGKQKATTFIFKDVAPEIVDSLASLNKDFSGGELISVPCAH